MGAMRFVKITAVLASALAVFNAGPAAAAGITDLGTLNGGNWSFAFGMNSDGTVVVGEVKDFTDIRAFRWTESGGMVSLGTFAGNSRAYAVSSDGAVVVGESAIDLGGTYRAFRWTEAGGMVSLGTLTGGTMSSAYGVNTDGTIVVGSADNGTSWRAFRWTQAGGMVSLGTLNSGYESHAFDLSADGSVVVGYSSDGANFNLKRAFSWTQAGGMTNLGVLNGGSDSRAYGVSDDGSVVVGEALDGAAMSQKRAFRWTEAGGMASLGVLNGGNDSFGWGVSGDGSVVVGYAADGAAGETQRAFRWTEAGGMQTVEDWLRDNGVSVASDMTSEARAANADGSVVVGTLENNHAFIARVAGGSGGGAGSGLITLADVSDSLSAAALGRETALSAAGTALNGAHSRPLDRRVEPGKKAFWLAGDWGRDDHGSRDGDIWLAELGFGYNLGLAQINLSIGKTGARQDMALEGRVEADGNYVMAEAIAPIRDSGLWLTLGAYGHRGDAEIRRGYLNAGTPDASIGNPDTETWGVRARIDWENAFSLTGAGLSPYVDISYAKARLDAYTEAGGGFPASFDEKSDHSTEARLGVNASLPLSERANLLGVLEAAHRFEESGARTSGQVIGLFAFDLDGQRFDQDWLRFGVGAEGKMGPGTASVMVNATTRGDMPSAWAAASYRISF